MPVSLSRGHLKTGDFKINIRAFYSILVVFPGGSEPNCSEYSLLRTRRLPSIGGRTVNHLEGDVDVHDSTTTVGPFLGGFESTPGHYSLEIEVSSDASCLDARSPKLWVIASRDDFENWESREEISVWVSLILALLGTVIAFVGMFGGHRAALGYRGPRIATGLSDTYASGAVGGLCTLRQGPLFKRGPPLTLPAIGLLYSHLLLLVILPSFLVFWSAWGYPEHFTGLHVQLVRADLLAMTVDPFTEPLVVRIDSHNIWYLNAKQISPAELPSALHAALARRASWIVYFDADSDMRFMDAAVALDIIQGARAKVVLLTPKTRAQAVSANNPNSSR